MRCHGRVGHYFKLRPCEQLAGMCKFGPNNQKVEEHERREEGGQSNAKGGNAIVCGWLSGSPVRIHVHRKLCTKKTKKHVVDMRSPSSCGRLSERPSQENWRHGHW